MGGTLTSLVLILAAGGRAWAQDAAQIAADVRAALGRGDCQAALGLASGGVALNAADAQAWRMQGDAQRCLGNNREAVRSYRKARELGTSDPVLDQLIDRAGKSLATVAVHMTGVDRELPPVFALEGGGSTWEPSRSAPEELLYSELPPGIPFTFSLRGVGYLPGVWQVPALGPGASFDLQAAAAWLGFGTVDLQSWPSGLAVDVRDASHEWKDVAPGPLRVVSGTAWVTVRGPNGTVEEALAVARDQTVPVSPSSMAPASVTLARVPGGSTVRFGPLGEPLSKTVDVPWERGEIDADSGLRMNAAVPLQGLRGGPHAFVVVHPLLGQVGGEFFAVGGEVGAQGVDWTNAPGLSDLRARYADHVVRERKAAARSRTHSALGVGASVAVIALSAGAVVVGVQAVEAGNDALDNEQAMNEANARGDFQQAGDYETAMNNARGASYARWAGAGVSAGLAGGSGMFAVFEFGRAKAARSAVPPWDPRTLLPPLSPAPVPPPPAALGVP